MQIQEKEDGFKGTFGQVISTSLYVMTGLMIIVYLYQSFTLYIL